MYVSVMFIYRLLLVLLDFSDSKSLIIAAGLSSCVPEAIDPSQEWPSASSLNCSAGKTHAVLFMVNNRILNSLMLGADPE